MTPAIVGVVVVAVLIALVVLGKIAEALTAAQRELERQQARKRGTGARPSGREGEALEKLLREAGILPGRVKRAPAAPEPPRTLARTDTAPAVDEHGGQLEAHKLGTAVGSQVGQELRGRRMDVQKGAVAARHIDTKGVGQRSVSEPAERRRGPSALERLDTLAPLARAVVLAEILSPPPGSAWARSSRRGPARTS